MTIFRHTCNAESSPRTRDKSIRDDNSVYFQRLHVFSQICETPTPRLLDRSRKELGKDPKRGGILCERRAIVDHVTCELRAVGLFVIVRSAL